MSIGFALLVGADSAPETATRYVFKGESKLWLEGTSTLHDYSCKAADLVGFADVFAENLEVSKTEVTIPVARLDCDNNRMNRLMTSALKMDANPNISFVLKSAKAQSVNGRQTTLVARGALTIAGTKRDIEMTVKGERLANGDVRFQGSHELLMSDFNVDRPTAMLGTIRTNDKVVVHFDVVAAAQGVAAR